MLLHIGENIGVPLENLLFVLNAQNITPTARAYIERAKKERRYMRCTGAPKAYAVTLDHGRETVYASMIATSTLEKRLRDEIAHRGLFEKATVFVEDA